MTNLVFLSLSIPIFLLLVPNVYAGDKYDWPEKYDDLPEGSPVLKCWTDGFVDGEDHPFNDERSQECQFDIGSPYYEAFKAGCMSVEGNTKDICESAVDA